VLTRLATFVAIGLQVALPDNLVLFSRWLMPGLVVVAPRGAGHAGLTLVEIGQQPSPPASAAR
jgi:hypothetical protein